MMVRYRDRTMRRELVTGIEWNGSIAANVGSLGKRSVPSSRLIYSLALELSLGGYVIFLNYFLRRARLNALGSQIACRVSGKHRKDNISRVGCSLSGPAHSSSGSHPTLCWRRLPRICLAKSLMISYQDGISALSARYTLISCALVVTLIISYFRSSTYKVRCRLWEQVKREMD